MALTEAETARLAALRTAYDALISGQRVARVRTSSGREVEYGPGDTAALKREIDQLEAAQVSTTGTRRGALRFEVR